MSDGKCWVAHRVLFPDLMEQTSFWIAVHLVRGGAGRWCKAPPEGAVDCLDRDQDGEMVYSIERHYSRC